MTTRIPVTNDKPKGDPSLASQIAMTVAMELGRHLGRTEVTNGDKPKEPAPAKRPIGNLFLAPKGDDPAQRQDDGQSKAVQNAEKAGYRVPKAEA